ncbi:MAG: tetratricopeptide repeat protein [Pseudomonadales bacterium]
MMQNYYLLLGLNQTASEEDIKAAISTKRKAEAKNQAHAKLERRQEAERVMQLLHEAQLILLDSQKRAKYDQELKSAPREEREIDESDLEGKEDYVALGWQLLIKGEVADALFVATKATEQDASNADAWALLAQAKFRWGETEDAIYEYKRAIKLRPNDAEFYFDLGVVYESADLPNEAYTQYQRAAQINPKDTNYRAATGALLVKNKEYEEGIKILEQCLQEDPDNKSYKWFLAIGLWGRAESYFWRNPEDDSGYVTSKDDAEKAGQIIDRALSLEYDDDDMRADLKELKEFLNGSFKRKFAGSWLLVILWGLFYVIPGVLMYVASLRPQHKLSRDVQKLIEENKGEDKFIGGEYGAYMHALPPGMKWAATLPRFIVWIVMIVLSPITFLYNIYDNWVAE